MKKKKLIKNLNKWSKIYLIVAGLSIIVLGLIGDEGLPYMIGLVAGYVPFYLHIWGKVKWNLFIQAWVIFKIIMLFVWGDVSFFDMIDVAGMATILAHAEHTK